MVSAIWIGILLFVMSCLIGVLYAPAATARQRMADRDWVTPPVSAPNLQQRIFFSRQANTDVSYHIYTPESYGRDKNLRYPVIFWLHGTHGAVKPLPYIVNYYEQAMRAGKLPPVIIVFPNGMDESLWVDSKDGTVPMESVVIKDLIPDVDKNFRTIADRKGRILEGFSMGGYGAARLGLKNPDLFGAVSIISAGPMQHELKSSEGPAKNAKHRDEMLQTLFGGDQNYFIEQSPWTIVQKNQASIRGKQTSIRLIVGAEDFTRPTNQEFSEYLFGLNIPHDFQLVPNAGHNPLETLQGLGESNWNFYRSFLGLSKLEDTDGYQPDTATENNPRNGMQDPRRQRILERIKQFDYDGDGIIMIDDLPPQARSRLSSLDTNRDGMIDPSEFSKFQR